MRVESPQVKLEINSIIQQIKEDQASIERQNDENKKLLQETSEG